MANIELKIVALGDFTSVNAQIEALQKQVTMLQKSVAGVGLTPQMSTQLKGIQSDFQNALVSSGQFTKQTVQLTSETQKFGQALTSGKLSLSQYYQVITGKSGEAQKSVNALANEQVNLNKSIVQQDITNKGVYSVLTPSNLTNAANSVEMIAAKQNIVNLAIKNGSTELINFGKNLQWSGRQITVGLAMPAVLFGSQAVTAFKAVNTELTRLQRLYGEGLTPPSQAQLNQISSQVLNLGKNIAQTMGIAQSDTVQVAANFAAMGIQGQQLLDVTKQTQRLSLLGGIDATQATSAIVSLQNVYKVSTNDLSNAVNFLSSMQKQTTMSLSDMTEAIPKVGPIMAQLGGTYKDTAVMLLAMKEAGIPAAQSANALKSAMASIIAPTSAANKEFASFGINLNSIKTAGSPVQMIEALQTALAPLSKMAQEQLIEKLFGKFQFSRISALLDNFGKVGSQTQNALKVAGATNSQLAALAGQEMTQATESTTAKWHRAIETLKADLYPIGQKILEVGTKIIDVGQKVIDFFNKLPGPVKTVLGVLAGLTLLSGPFLMLTGLFAQLFAQVVKGGTAFMSLFDGTKRWKDLLTPASVAAKVATDALNEGILSNVSSVDTLTAALDRMIASLEAINMNFNATTDTSLLAKVENLAVGEAATGALVLPGMATGGYVPGNPADGDAYPAMLMGGEAVIPTKQAQQYSPFINAMINGTLPMYAGGRRSIGRNANDVLREKYSIASRFSGMGGFGGTAGRSLNRSSMYPGMTEEQAAIRESVISEGGSEEEARHLSRPVIEHTVPNIPARTPTLGIPYNRKSTDLNDTMSGLEAANLYGSALTDKNGNISAIMSEYMKAVKNGKVSFEGLANSQEDLIKELEKMRPNVSADTEQHKKIMQSIAAYDKEVGLSTEDQKKIRSATQAQLAARKSEFYEGGSTPAPGGLIRGSDKYEAQRQKIMSSSERGWKQHEFHIDATAMTKNPSLMTAENASMLRLNSAGAINFASGPMTTALDEAVASGRKSVKEQEGIASPAKMWEEEIGKPMAQGIGQGFKDEIPQVTESIKQSSEDIINGSVPTVKTMGNNAGETLAEEFGNGMKSSSSQSKLQTLFTSAFGSSSKIGGLISKFSNMGMMGKMGVGMGLTTGAQMLSPMLNKLPGGNLMTDTLSGAGMGAGFGPWGMAAGAAISLVTGGIKDLMAAEKQSNAETKADFTSSTDAVQFLGGAVGDTTDAFKTLGIQINNTQTGLPSSIANEVSLAKGIQYTTTQLQAFQSVVKSLTPDNPLALIIKQVEGASQGQASELATQFATMQMAINGISQAQATQLAQLIMTVGGKNGATTSVGVTSQIEAIKSSINSALPNTKQFAQVMGQLANLAVNASTFQQYEMYIKAIGESAATSAQQLQGLFDAFGQNGDTNAQKLVGDMLSSGKNYNASDVTAIQLAQKNGYDVNFDQLNPGQVQTQLSNMTVAGKKVNELTTQTSAMAAATQKVIDTQKAISNASSGATAAIAGQTAAVKNNVAGLTAQQKVLDANLKSLQDLQKQYNQNTTYATTSEDLKNQILMAQGTGDNLKAQMLQQQLLGTTRDFNMQNKVDAAQQASDANKQKLDDANAAVQTAQTVATNNSTAALTTLNTNLANYQAALKTLAGKIILSQSSGATPDSSLKANANAPTAGSEVFDPKTDQLKTAGYGPGQITPKNSNLPLPANGEKKFFNPLANGKHNYPMSALPKPYGGLPYYDMVSKLEYDPISGLVLDSSNKPVGRWAQVNSLGLMTGYAKGGVARTNSSITYHKQHMTRQARRFVDGGHISGPGTGTSDSIPAMLSNGEYVVKADSVSHYGTGFFDAVNAKRLAKGGVARTNSSITYHKQHMTRQARRFASGGYVPSITSNLMSLSHPAFAAGGYVHSPVNASSNNIVYNINVTANSDNANEIAKVVMQTLKQAESRMAMSGRSSKVGN